VYNSIITRLFKIVILLLFVLSFIILICNYTRCSVKKITQCVSKFDSFLKKKERLNKINASS